VISEETIRKKALGWLTILKELLVIGTLAWGFFGALPWVKNKVKQAETVADSTLALVNSIQTQLQIQIQQQAQLQTQHQGQVQGQRQEQQMTNVQQTEVTPANITILPDTTKPNTKEEKAVAIDSLIECNTWKPIPTSHDAEFRIECALNVYDSIKALVRFKQRVYSSVLQKGQEVMFVDSSSLYQRWVYLEFKSFEWQGFPRVRMKYVDYFILDKKRP
jgi:hypothetical protein